MTGKPWEKPWFDLFYAFERDHACGVIEDRLSHCENSDEMGALARTMARLIIQPLEQYIDDRQRDKPSGYLATDIEAANAFMEQASTIADYLLAGHTISDAGTEIAQFKAAWTEFIAIASGPRIYHDLVRSLQKEDAHREKGKVNGAMGGAPCKVDHEAVCRDYEKYLQMKNNKRDAKSTLYKKYPQVDPRQIRNILKKCENLSGS